MTPYDPRDFYPFIAAARCGNFSLAARLLQVTPSAVSKSIARLEKALDARLFNRSTRQLQLTVAGHEFHERLGKALEGIDAAVESLNEARQSPSGLLRISTIVAFGRYFVLPLIREFHARYPQVELELQFDDGTGDFIKERFDIAIRRGPIREGRSIARQLCTLPLILVASPAYLADKGTPLTPQDLAMHECVSIRFPSGRRARWTFYSPGSGKREKDPYTHYPKGGLVVSEQPADVLIDAALMGAGVTAIAACFVLPWLRSGELKVLLPEYRLERDSEVFIQYSHREHLPLKVRVFSEFLIERLRDDERLTCAPQTLARYAAVKTLSERRK